MTDRGGPILFVALALLSVILGCQTVQEPPQGAQWGQATRIEARPDAALRPQVAIDAMGNALAVWDQTDGTQDVAGSSDDIWSNRREVGGQWDAEAAELLERYETEEDDDAVEAQIAVDGEGNAIVVFRQTDGEYFRIWAIRRTLTGWEDPVCIHGDADDPECIALNVGGDALAPQVAVDPEGNAVAVWQQVDGTDERLSVWSNRYTIGEGWGRGGPVESNTNDWRFPEVAVDAKGDAIVVWEAIDDDGRSSIWSRRLRSDGVREDLLTVEVARGNAFFPRVVVDAAGNAIAVWEQEAEGTDGRFGIWSNRYVASTGGWDLAERIDTAASGNTEKPQVAMDGDGNAIAVWAQSGGDRPGIWSNRYAANVGWDAPAVPIGPGGLDSARAPQVASSPGGDAVAVWVQFDGDQDSVWSNHYRVNGRWGRSQPIETNDEFRVTGPQVAMDFDGNAVAVWSQQNSESAFDLWSNSFE